MYGFSVGAIIISDEWDIDNKHNEILISNVNIKQAIS